MQITHIDNTKIDRACRRVFIFNTVTNGLQSNTNINQSNHQVVEGTTSSVVTVEPLEDGMGASVEALDWNVEGITSSIVDASACSVGLVEGCN